MWPDRGRPHRLQLGDATAVLEVAGRLKPELTWLGADGKKRKSVPASMKGDFAADLKSLKQSAKEIAKLLPAQARALERLFLQERTWTFPEFRSRYLDHPLVGILAHPLIWRYSDGAHAGDGIWWNGQIVDDRDQILDWLRAQTRVACGIPWRAASSRSGPGGNGSTATRSASRSSRLIAKSISSPMPSAAPIPTPIVSQPT